MYFPSFSDLVGTHTQSIWSIPCSFVCHL